MRGAFISSSSLIAAYALYGRKCPSAWRSGLFPPTSLVHGPYGRTIDNVKSEHRLIAGLSRTSGCSVLWSQPVLPYLGAVWKTIGRTGDLINVHHYVHIDVMGNRRHVVSLA